MCSRDVFISHATADDDFVTELRTALEGHGLRVWVDSRELVGGNKLEPEIEKAIEEARQVIAVLSPNTINSSWVRKEIQIALEVEKRRKEVGYRVIPLLLPGIEPSALENWFDEEPLGVRIELKVGGVSEALPQVLAALGERLPDDYQPMEDVESRPVEDLVLELKDPEIKEEAGVRRRRPGWFTTPLTPLPAKSKASGSPLPRLSVPSRARSCAGTWRATPSGRSGCLWSGPSAPKGSYLSGVLTYTRPFLEQR